MLCTFTTETNGTLIIRSDDIRMIEDGATDKAELIWLIGDEITTRTILGTALENAARLQQEELDLIGRVEAHRQQLQQRMQAGYPAQPVQRGRK